SDSDPVWPRTVVAPAEVNAADPKSANGRVWQELPSHCDGASTIHSAEVTSTVPMRSDLVNVHPRLRSRSTSVVVCPWTVTLAAIRSPGLTGRKIGYDGAGTVSYHAVELVLPDRVQSTSVPICSRAGESELNPPRPTQYEEKLSVPGRQEAPGWVHAARTVWKPTPGR